MGKRVEKALQRDKGQAASASSHDQEEQDPNKPPEPYLCTGHFQTDFTELCRRASMVVIPPIVPRPRRPASPTLVVQDEPKAKAKGADKKKQVVEVAPEPEPELDQSQTGEPPEPPPKTYSVKDKFEFFKPCIQVEMDYPEKLDTVNELFVRGWRVDATIMGIFKECFPRMEKLHTINFWNTGLTGETLEQLSNIVLSIPNLRCLNLDNNAVKEQNYHLFIKEDSPLQHLSLKYNGISESGAKEIGKHIGLMTNPNHRLVAVNLSGNRIGDEGAIALANGLRMNRTLLALSISQNHITDAGAKRFGEVLSRFPITHEELVERRKLMSSKDHSDRKSPPPGSRRADSRDRPGSTRSVGVTGGKAGKSAKAGKKETKGKDEKETKGKTKDDKADKKKGANTSGRNSGASVVNDTKATVKEKGKKGKKATKEDQESPSPESDSPELFSPLTDAVETLDNGVVVLTGNRCLANLNLSHNDIGEDGLKALLLAINYQTTLSQFSNKPGTQGLMRLAIHRNKVAKDNETLQKLNAQMLTKDPFYKAPPVTPDIESQHSKT